MAAFPKQLIKEIAQLATEAQDLSMWGALPPFPWERFSSALIARFERPFLRLFPGRCGWESAESVFEGMGESPLHMTVQLSPLRGSLTLLFSVEDVATLSSWLIAESGRGEPFNDPYLQKGFLHFLTLEAFATLQEEQLFAGLTPSCVEMPLTREAGYCIDIGIENGEECVWGRLIAPSLFHQSMKSHYAADWSLSTPSSLYSLLDIPLAFTVGAVSLSQAEWRKVKEGDFILLDRCSYHPNLRRGTFQLQVGERPLFQVKMKEEAVKILDYAHYFEETAMDDQSFEPPFEEEMEEEFLSEEEQGEEEEASPPDELLSPKEVPIALTVEVARMRMSLESLLKLKPGSVLDLTIQVEQGVTLTANGKAIGRGELLQIGDVIGVKVTKLG